jgi:hypothetical protein
LLNRKSGRGAPSKKDGFDPAAWNFQKPPVKVEQDRIEESLCLVAVGSFLVEAAVRTNLGTERDVNVEMMQFQCFLNSVLDLHKYDYNPASCSELS